MEGRRKRWLLERRCVAAGVSSIMTTVAATASNGSDVMAVTLVGWRNASVAARVRKRQRERICCLNERFS